MVAAERAFLDWLSGLEQPAPALAMLATQYGHFSLHQVIAFAGIFRTIPPRDVASLAELADVLYEELGRGQADRVHSALFGQFARAVGAPEPGRGEGIVQGVQEYVRALDDAFSSGSLPRALAAYEFLECSAVETYGPLLAVLERHGVAPDALKFFTVHATVEPGHLATAERLMVRAGFDEPQRAEAARERLNLEARWDRFWADIHEDCRRASGRVHEG